MEMPSINNADMVLSVGKPPESFRKYLRVEGERLRIRHRLGLGGVEVACRLSELVDQVICEACRVAEPSRSAGSPRQKEISSDYAVVGIGGYGRQELAPFSDVDLLFLLGGQRAEEIKRFCERVLYSLWDAGLVVGHSLRTVGDCVATARSDLHFRTALATARFLTGDEKLFRKLSGELARKVYANGHDNERFLDALTLEIESRYEKFGRAVCLQEPNVKEGVGGLRDLHTVEWLGNELFGVRSVEALRDESFITAAEHRQARRAYDFIARVRNEAHFVTGRKTDLLTLDLQPQLAANLGYKHGRSLLDSEAFMRDYYRRASELHRFCDRFLARARGLNRGKRRLAEKRVKPLAAGFEVRGGEIRLKEPDDSLNDPVRLMAVFSVAQVENVPLSDEVRLAVENNLKLVTRAFRTSPQAAQLFREVLGRRGAVGKVLRLMHEAGLLGKLVPEFARITFLVQHDYYHRYTIDEHTLRAVEALDRLSDADTKSPRLKGVFAEIENAAPLYIGALLHDIGKGRGGGHVARGTRIAERVCAWMKLEDEATQEVLFLVEQHLLMSHLAERRDLSEGRLIEEFAVKAGSIRRLNMLLLLTYADCSAVAPGVWNDWREGLLWELYSRARERLTVPPTALTLDPVIRLKQRAIDALSPDFPPSQVERHFAMLPERYARAYDAGQIARHIRLTRQLNDDALVADWRQLEDRQCTELVVCARDHKGLFAQIAGALTACGINILSADLCTREDGVALDTFKLAQVASHQPIRSAHWHSVERRLRAAVVGNDGNIKDQGVGDVDNAAPVGAWLKKSPRRSPATRRRPPQPRLRFDSESSAVSTIIEVKAADEPGLACRIAGALAVLGINISFARITTEKNRALDVFYVDSGGRKLSSEEMTDVAGALTEILMRQQRKGE